MNFNEERYQPRIASLWNYLKQTFHYEYLTYDIPKSYDAVLQLLASYFKKINDNKRIRNIYGELPDTNTLYMEYRKQNNFFFIAIFDLLSPTCLKGTFYSTQKNHTKIEIGVRVHSNYLLFFILSLVTGAILSFSLCKKNHTDLAFLIPLSVSVVIMIIVVKMANLEKYSLRQRFEEVIGAESLS